MAVVYWLKGHCDFYCTKLSYLSSMSVRKTIPEKDGVYFITFTRTDWISLFSICNAYDAVYKWFDILKANNHLYNRLCYYAASCACCYCI